MKMIFYPRFLTYVNPIGLLLHVDGVDLSVHFKCCLTVAGTITVIENASWQGLNVNLNRTGWYPPAIKLYDKRF